MKAIEILGLMALVTLIYNVSLFFIKYKRKAYMNKEQVTIEANLESYDETAKLKARIEFLESELSSFIDISDKLQKQLNKTLDEFEAYVRLTQGEQEKPVKRSVTSLQEKECIRIGEGDWEKLAPLFEEAGIVWWKGQKASEIIPEIGYCVSVNYYGKNELTQDSEHFNVENGFTVLPASDFIEPERIEATKPVKHLSEVNAIDWSKPVAFPVGYKIPIGIECVTLDKDIWGGFITPIGTKIKVLGYYGKVNSSPYFERMDGVHREKNIDHQESGYCDGCLPSFKLTPINPTDHPNHPDYVER